MKKILLIFSVLFNVVFVFAIKPEKELNKLYVGISAKEVKELYGDPKYSKFEKDTKIRMYLYDFYKTEGGLAEYHLYFKDDSLTYIMQYIDKQEILRPIMDSYMSVSEDSIVHNYSIEGKCLVVSKIIEGIAIGEEQTKDAVVVAISRACNGSQGEFKMKEATRIIYHGIIDKVITFDWKWGSVNIFYTVDVAIKQGRVRVKVIGEEIDWHQDNDKATYYFSDTYPIGGISMKGVSGSEAQQMINNTTRIFGQYISVIEEELLRNSNDDW